MNKPTIKKLVAKWRVKGRRFDDGIHNTVIDLNNYKGSLSDKEAFDKFVDGRIAEHFKHAITWEIVEMVEVE